MNAQRKGYFIVSTHMGLAPSKIEKVCDKDIAPRGACFSCMITLKKKFGKLHEKQ